VAPTTTREGIVHALEQIVLGAVLLEDLLLFGRAVCSA